MIYDSRTIDQLQELEAKPWQGNVFRHMLSEFPPDRENSRGARWNPPETRAIYTSLTRETVLAEAEFYLRAQPLIPRVKRTIYKIAVVLSSMIDLSGWDTLAKFGIDKDLFESVDYGPFQMVGGAVEWLGHDGLVVPSARFSGINLVIFPNRQASTYKFEVLDSQEL